MSVAVVYASKYGSTEEIAQAIAAELAEAGVDAAVLNADELREFPHSRALVIGSAVYAGHWRKSTRDFVQAYGPELRGREVWLFSSGPIGDTGPDGSPADLDELMEKTGARSHAVFAGKLDPDRLSLTERLLVKALKAPSGDFRDWDAIRRWARAVAMELESISPAATPAR